MGISNNYNRGIYNSSAQPEFKNNNLISPKISSKSQDFLEISFEPKAIFKILCLIIICLISISTLGQIYKYAFNGGNQGSLITLFYLDAEANIPTIYSSFALLLCSVLLAIVTISKHRGKDHYYRHWQFLSLIFLYLAIDEGAKIHEISIIIIRMLLNTSLSLHFSGVTFAIILCSLFALVYLKRKFIFSLSKNTKFLFVFGIAIFIFAVLGREMIAGKNQTSTIITTVEEALKVYGFFHFPWVIPAIILCSLFAIVYLKFVFSLPKYTRFLFILGAIIFVSGALGIEMIGGSIVSSKGGMENITYVIIATFEEALEMFGIAIFIYALLKYIENYVEPLKIRF